MSEEEAKAAKEKAEQEAKEKEAKEKEENKKIDELEEFEEWLETQPEAVQQKYKEQTSGLVNALRNERVSNKTLRKDVPELHKLREADEKRQADQLSETERLTKQATDAETERDTALQAVKDSKIESALILEATTQNFINPGSDPLAMIDLSTITLDESGKVQGVKKALKTLATAKPYLIVSESVKRGTFTGARTKKRGSKTEKPVGGPRVNY